MTFTLHVDAAVWRAHIDSAVGEMAKLGVSVTAVVKGNGYGFGTEVLCREAIRMGLPAVAVGTVYEAETALAHFARDVIVLEPLQPGDAAALRTWRRVLAHHAARTVVTVAGPYLQDAASAGAQRVRLEGSTSMHRFGLDAAGLDAALRAASHSLTVEALTLHLPLAEPHAPVAPALEVPGAAGRGSGWLREALGWIGSWRSLAADHGLPLRMSVSHLAQRDLAAIRSAAPDVALEARIGTRLWLGEPRALRATGTVLAVHDESSDRTHVGYTQVDAGRRGTVLVISGGTSHGVALAAPSAPTTVRRRAISLAEGVTEAVGRVASPFTVDGHALRFVEPPHMHTSMVWCRSAAMAVGDQVECRVRLTTALFDEIVGLDTAV